MKQAVKILCGMFMLFLFAPVMQAQALSDGVYTASVETFYINPDTGVTDDGGSKNAAIGEGMCRSAVFESALVEVENGKTYVTIRMLLASNVKNTTFTVQQTAGDAGSYQSVSASMMAEDANSDSRDYRFAVPGAGSYIGCSMYVTPMGRDVKFYMQVQEGSASAGSGDFVVSISPKSEASTQESTSAPVSSAASGGASASTGGSTASVSQSTASGSAAAASTQTTTAAQSSTKTQDATGTQDAAASNSADASDETQDADDAQDVDDVQDEAEDAQDAVEVEKTSRETRGSNISVVETTGEDGLGTAAKVAIACAVVLVIAGAAGGYVYYMKKKKTKEVTQTGGDTK